jgi:hypothetical protein
VVLPWISDFELWGGLLLAEATLGKEYQKISPEFHHHLQHFFVGCSSQYLNLTTKFRLFSTCENLKQIQAWEGNEIAKLSTNEIDFAEP